MQQVLAQKIPSTPLTLCSSFKANEAAEYMCLLILKIVCLLLSNSLSRNIVSPCSLLSVLAVTEACCSSHSAGENDGPKGNRILC